MILDGIGLTFWCETQKKEHVCVSSVLGHELCVLYRL